MGYRPCLGCGTRGRPPAPRRHLEEAAASNIVIGEDVFREMLGWRWPDEKAARWIHGMVCPADQQGFHALRLSIHGCLDHLRGKADLLEANAFNLNDIYDFVFGGVIITVVESGPVRLLAGMAEDQAGKCHTLVVGAELEDEWFDRA